MNMAQTVAKTQELVASIMVHEIYESKYGEMMVYVFEDASIVEKVVITNDDEKYVYFFQLGTDRTFDSRNKLELIYSQSDYLEWVDSNIPEEYKEEYSDY